MKILKKLRGEVMSTIIYLDQNILSDLRQKKIDSIAKKEFKLLKFALKSKHVTVVYSYVNLEEILQIEKIEYQQEHIEVLMELSAQYIEPLTCQLKKTSPESIWNEYLGIIKSNNEMGIDSLMYINQLLSRKLSGLLVEESFDEINNMLKDRLTFLIAQCEAHIPLINSDGFTSLEEEQVIHLTEIIKEFRERIENLKALEINNEQALGPKPFRETIGVKSLNIENVEINHVVDVIERIFKQENCDFSLEQYFDSTVQSEVVRAYSLMNWAGYHADDFTKNRKSKDRFNASNRDMQHVSSALGADFLISNDNKFRKKAMACFAYVGCKTMVCNSKDFIEKYCKFV
jgi:hypothetical protein